MYLQRIVLANFKNISSVDLSFSSKINCLCGNNGAGKTNLLDAVYYLSMTKSFISQGDQMVFSYGVKETTLHGVYSKKGLEERIAISVSDGAEKCVKRNMKNYPKLSEHIGVIPIVIVSPADSYLISDSGEQRRKFMNNILSQTDKEYLRSIQTYNRVLAQRNKTLKENVVSKPLLETFDAMLSKEGNYINKRRGELIVELSTLTSEFYKKLSGGREEVSMEYVSDLSDTPLELLLKRDFEKDLNFKYTTCGIQRDDILFIMDGYNMRKSASQGQQKTFLVALKLAQFSMMRSLYGFPPILLLDDVFDKLDLDRVKFLINMVATEDFGQIFITDSNKTRITEIINSITNESKIFSVDKGVFKEIEE